METRLCILGIPVWIALCGTAFAGEGVPMDISGGFNMDAWCGQAEYQELQDFEAANPGANYNLVDSQVGVANSGNYVMMAHGLPQFLLSQMNFMYGSPDGTGGGTPVDGVLTSANDGRTYHIASHAGNATLPGDWLAVANPAGGDGNMDIKNNAMCVFAAHNKADAQIASVTAMLPVSQQKKYPSINFLLGAFDLAVGAKAMRITAIYTDSSEEVLHDFPTTSGEHGPSLADGAGSTVPAGVFSAVGTFSTSYYSSSEPVGTLQTKNGTFYEFTNPLPLNADKTLQSIRLGDTDAEANWSSRGLAIFAATGSAPPPETGAEFIIQ